MKKLLLIFCLLVSYFVSPGQTENLQGNYQVDGYFFHPTYSRRFSLRKTITQINSNTYQVNLADVLSGDFSFQFSIDENNNLVNWVAIGSTPVASSSNFMTADNPGGQSFDEEQLPGVSPYQHSIYNNTYDPATHTFWMHYGYDQSSSDQNGYTRQVYEKYVFVVPLQATSFSPDHGSPGTVVTFKGTGFSSVLSVSFDTNPNSCDTFMIESDTVMKAVVGMASPDLILLRSRYVLDTLGEFNYIPPAAVNDNNWASLGSSGLSAGPASNVGIAISRSNVPMIVYIDSATKRAYVKKYTGSTWTDVGGAVSDGRCSNAVIAISQSGVPFVSYIDLENGGNITVKKLQSNSWVTVGSPGFASSNQYRLNTDLSLDGITPYVISTGADSTISVYTHNGTSWVNLGAVGKSFGGSALAIDEINHIPYVVFSDAASTDKGAATVKKYSGATWVVAGNANFAKPVNGIYYPIITLDRAGNPIVAMQEDDGFERISVYKLANNIWSAFGPQKFSKAHSYEPSLALDKNNLPVVAFRDGSYNDNGTVMHLNNSGTWNRVGSRGFAPANSFYKQGLAIDTTNNPLLAFIDKNNGNKVGVMRYAFPLRSSGNVILLCPNANTSITASPWGNTYQWQVSTDSINFNNITNGVNYSGVTTSTLQLNNLPSAYYGYQYRCIVDGLAGNVTTLEFANTWTGALNNAWENAANWSCGTVPDSNTDVVINSGTVVVNTNTAVRSLAVNANVNFIVSPGVLLTITH